MELADSIERLRAGTPGAELADDVAQLSPPAKTGFLLNPELHPAFLEAVQVLADRQ